MLSAKHTGRDDQMRAEWPIFKLRHYPGMGWIDQIMDRLYKAARQAVDAEADTLQSGQRSWIAQRNRCKGTDMQVMNCVDASYRRRFAEIAAPYDAAHLTGTYDSAEARGFLVAVLFPDRSLAVNLTSSAGPPSYDMCGLDFQAAVQDGRLRYTPTPDENPGDHACTFDLSATGGPIVVGKTGCDDFCGNSARIVGTYKRQR